MLLVFAIASRTICTPTTSAHADASPAELRALALSLYQQPRPEVEKELGAPYEGMGSLKQNWRCYARNSLDYHVLYDSSGKASSVLVCQLKPEKTLLVAYPSLDSKLSAIRLRRAQLARR